MSKFSLKKKVSTSLSAKLTFLYVGLVFIPIFVAIMLFVDYFNKETEEKYLNTVYNNLIQIDNNIRFKTTTVIHSGKTIVTDPEIGQFLIEKNLSDYERIINLKEYVRPRLNGIKVENPDIEDALMIHANDTILNGSNCLQYQQDLNMKKWDEKFETMRNLENMDPYNYYKVYLELLEKEQIYRFYMPIYNFLNLENYMGILTMDVKSTVFESALLKNDTDEEDILCFVDGMNQQILFSDNDDLGSLTQINIKEIPNYERVRIGEKVYRIVKYYDSDLNCYLVQFAHMTSIFNSNNFYLIFAMGVAALVYTLFTVSWVISKIVLKNLYQITRAINKAKEGNYVHVEGVNSQDELGQISVRFNNMVDKTNQLMEDLKKASIAEKEAIYQAMENQIKPHFLCNALDMVRMTAKLRQEEDISNAILTITHYFMYNLSERGKYVTLETEMKNVLDYVNIHNMIKNRAIHCDIDAAGELSGNLNKYRILKFSLQPIVENCIKHGFSKRTDDCYIFINIRKKEDRLVISIEDNGNGISEERLAELQYMLLPENLDQEEEKVKAGIGLRNIRNRFLMNYGKEYAFVLESYPEIGTCITLEIPITIDELVENKEKTPI